ncbi:MAG: NAD(+) diphosphatase [Rhodospirillales bacterium]|jgi:NAD+ diphosphatase|nr:NAD(+) diphosphatase [Rhodospirillales bacterium]
MRALHYTDVPLDRAEPLRRDEEWQRERLADPGSRIFPVWRSRSLVTEDVPQAVALAPGAALLEGCQQVVFLGLDGSGQACFAADVSDLDDRVSADGARFIELRRVGAVLDRGEGAVLAYARGILHWHRRHRFCGACGSPTESRDGGHMRACTGAACGAHHFPGTDPAVIMLITREVSGGAQCLLARQARWPKGMMSTLAGFVEPGESLEEAVTREVEEETGIRIAYPSYRGSQPWPFPASLMLGFRGEAEPDAVLRVNAAELEDARWFDREELRQRKRIGLILPGRDSIARRLIEEWVQEGEGGETAQTEEAQRCPAL